MKPACARAEIVAGAIALGEATETERDEYRRHIAACASCLAALGGEREIERIMRAVADARDAETWEPVVPSPSARRSRTLRRAWRFGVSSAALAIVVSFAIHLAIVAFLRPVSAPPASALAQLPQSTMRVTLERPPAPVHAKAVRHASEPSIVVVHNVITLKSPPRATVDRDAQTPVRATETRVSTATTVVAAATAAPSDVPIWRRDAALPIARAPQPPVLQGRAESIAVAPSYVIRDATPLGGDTAIDPRPPLIAYSQGAEGTTAFEVSVDERGNPQRCTITKSSGYLSLDDAVCAAAMHARYAPRTVNGRATPGVYRDAFTFRAQTRDESPQVPEF